MNKQQLILILLGLATLAGLYLFGPTVDPARKAPNTSPATGASYEVTIEQQVMAGLNPGRQKFISGLKESVKRGDVKDQSVHIYHQLARFWKDSVPNPFLHFTYTAKAAELENTEKSLTFAAHSILGYLPYAQSQQEQTALAENGKVLFDKALQLNPANDSSIVGSGACIMYGASSGQDGMMNGIMKVREVAQKDSNNMFAQYMLGVGGMISRQYDKAAVRFEKVVKAQPDNLEALFKLAEAYEQMGNKEQAIGWYKVIDRKVTDKEVKAAISSRIKELESK